MADFYHLKVGDRVMRYLGGETGVSMLMEVTAIDDNLVTCAAVQAGGLFRGGWTFDRNSGVEEDHGLQWGVKFGITGSYIKEITSAN